METPIFGPLKKNGTSFYVFPSVAEDANYQTANENYRMYLSHYVLVNFPQQVIGTDLDFTNKGASGTGPFYMNATHIVPATFADQLVESLRNYVANEEATIRNAMINQTTFYYDTSQAYTTTEKIFWKWAKELNIIGYEPADPIQEYFGADPKYNDNGPSGNTNSYREYLWKERSTTIYDVTAVTVPLSPPVNGTQLPLSLPSVSPKQYASITLSSTTKLIPGDFIIINQPLIDNVTPGLGYSSTQSLLEVAAIAQTNTLNDTIVVIVDAGVTSGSFGTVTDREVNSAYQRFVQFICEIGGLNNVQLPDRSYTETYAYISHQHGQIPYALWNLMDDNNYKPNSQFPILASQIQAEIQGGENPNNPILTNPSLYPGDIWGQFDTSGFIYTTQTGDVTRRWGNYYGNSASTNVSPTLLYPDFTGSTIDGLTLNLNINDYAEAVSYVYPIQSFNEFCATSFNNVPPADFQFNAILWYYTIEDVTGNTTASATNLYGVEFLDNPQNDLLHAKTMIPVVQKLVTNGYQNGNSYSFSLDVNIALDTSTDPPAFDPDKVYSLFGMELYYEALTRITYFNDQITNFVNSNLLMSQQVADLTGLVYNQQSLDGINNRMNNIEALLNVYATLQIGNSDTIVSQLDTGVSPPLLRLNSVDKQYGFVYQYKTTAMFTEFTDVNSLTDISPVVTTIPVVNGKDFLVVINNNDNRVPAIPYDTTKTLSHLSIVIGQDLDYLQKMDIIVTPFVNSGTITTANPVNYPINDKLVDIFINYDDGTSTINKLLTTVNLPVMQYYNGTTYVNEPVTGLDSMPSWKISNVYYAQASTNERIFSFVVEEDLLNILQQSSRIYLDNFLMEQNPALIVGNYNDLSGQYAVYNAGTNPSYVRSHLVNVEVINAGSGYSNGVIAGIVYSTEAYTADILIAVDGSGHIVSAELVNFTGLTTEALLLASPTYVSLSGGTGGKVKFTVKHVTRVNIAMNINGDAATNTFLAGYDTITNASALPLNTYVNLAPYLKMNPPLSLYTGMKISITRITNTDLPVTQLDQRYNIQIDKI